MPIQFTINGKAYTVRQDNFPADTTLNTFIREYAKLAGTKFFCLEGGCGVCTVTVRSHHLVTNRYYSRAVNSCLVLLNSCHGWDIITIEGLGDRHVGYHPIQERLAHFNGSQCGFCSPGMVMNMFSSLEASGGKITANEIEDSFGGNLCRCTGYRPILDTMKSFAADCDYEFVDTSPVDIEDLKICPKIGEVCAQKCYIPSTIRSENHRMWYHPKSIQEILDSFNDIKNERYMLVAGNTGHGIYRRDPTIQHFFDLYNVPELLSYTISDVFEIGGNVPLTEVMNVMQENSERNGFEYFCQMLKHLKQVGHVQLRNTGTIAGNLMLKHEHNEFVSDIFLLLTTIGAKVTIVDITGEVQELSLPEFLKIKMNKRIISKVVLPKLNKSQTLFYSYKISPRAQNATAFVNAGFLFTIIDAKVACSRICYGGINPQFIESSSTSEFLLGRDLYSPDTTAGVLKLLEEELQPDWVLPNSSPEFRKRVAMGLFYKFILKTAPQGQIAPNYLSGGQLLSRPLSSGAQYFDTREKYWPVNKPIRKLEALWQCSGEANYANDISHMKDEVWAAFVPATKVLETVVQIDSSDALSIPGVIAFYSAKDIPGTNTFVTPGSFALVENEELFCSGVVRYHSQPVGIILAETLELANYAAKKVKILNEHDNKKRCLKANMNVSRKKEDIDKILDKLDESLPHEELTKNKQIRGYLDMASQFHFSMETQITVCIPREDGLIVYPSSHYIDLIQTGIVACLKLQQNQIDVDVRRCGGSFGCKISRSNHAAVACALGSWLSHRPVRFFQTIESNMKTNGKRNACTTYYTLTINDIGKILSLAIDFYEDMGNSKNENPIEIFTKPAISNCYEQTSSWTIKGVDVLTDAPSNTWTRAPGTLEGIAMLENIMEHIAWTLNKDPVDIRLNNIPKKSEMKKLLPDFIKSTEYRERRKKINSFNAENRWKKRGIGISLMRFHIFYFAKISAEVAIYHFDGTVSISHGGVEVGQGLNTKAAQVAAYTFGIPLEMVNVKSSNSFNGANSVATGGSVASETVCFAVQKACDQLLARMKPIRDKMKKASWSEVVMASHNANINLVSRQTHKVGELKGYDVWGLSCTEVEVDILTGNLQIPRVDILEDTGESLNPLLDVGQVEGAFVMGLGYWLTEKLTYDIKTGELLTDRTLNYKVPGAKDIPIDFRITLFQKKPNSKGFLRSKTTGEMAICMSISVVFALRHALDSARKDAGIKEWYHLGAPTTIEDIVLNAGHTRADFKFSDQHDSL